MGSERHLPFSSVFNFRDLGGYPTAGGRTVRQGVLYRADGLFRLTGEDIARFGELNVRSVVDLRRPDELDSDGRVPHSPTVTYHNVCLQLAPWTAADIADEEMPRYLADRYAEIAEEGARTGAMGTVLRLIADSSRAPVVFHCAAGKDRTGVVAALVLALLDVPDETIAEDYAASRTAEDRYRVWRSVNQPDLKPLTGNNPAPAEAMHSFLTEVRARYGSVVDYTEHAGLTSTHRTALREHLLEHRAGTADAATR